MVHGIQDLKIRNMSHLSSTVFGIVILCAISIVVIFLILRVLLTGWRLCNQQREDGLQDGVQQLLLQYSLQRKRIYFVYLRSRKIKDSCSLSGLMSMSIMLKGHCYSIYWRYLS